MAKTKKISWKAVKILFRNIKLAKNIVKLPKILK